MATTVTNTRIVELEGRVEKLEEQLRNSLERERRTLDVVSKMEKEQSRQLGLIRDLAQGTLNLVDELNSYEFVGRKR